MGSGEMGTPTKTAKTSTTQEQPLATTTVIYPDWAAAFQAYYSSGATPPLPPPAYFHSTMASSPQPHPYMWGAQPIIPPYGTPPPPYAAMYARGGMYAHPSIPPGAHPYGPYGIPPSGGATENTPGTATAVVEADAKLPEPKDQSPLKRSRGSLGSLSMLTGKANEAGKVITRSANSVSSQSGESGSEGSTEGSDDSSQNGSQAGQKTGIEQGSTESAMVQNTNPAFHNNAQGGSNHAASGAQATNTSVNQIIAAVPISVAGKSATVAGPTTNLNIGMDYWSMSPLAPLPTVRGRRGVTSTIAGAITTAQNVPLLGHRDSLPPEFWLQDEKELKKQRRKQSNRESARRSRLRKQAECEELAERVQTLKAENVALRAEMNRLAEEHKMLTSEHASLHEQFRKAQGEKANKDGRLEGNEEQSANAEQHEKAKDNTQASTIESMPREGRREAACNLDGRNQPHLDSRCQAGSNS